MERTHFLVATAVAAALALPSPGLADSARMERFRGTGTAADPEAPPALVSGSGDPRRHAAVRASPRRRPGSTTARTVFAAGTAVRVDRMRTTSFRCVRSTTTASSSRRSEARRATASGRPTTPRAAASATRTWSPARPPARSPSTAPAAWMAGAFFESHGGSLDPDPRHAFRASSSACNVRGRRPARSASPRTPSASGFVEAIANEHAAREPRQRSPPPLRGDARPEVPVLEANGSAGRIGRFGWKSPARQPRVIRRGRLPERNGHHDAPVSRGKPLER